MSWHDNLYILDVLQISFLAMACWPKLSLWDSRRGRDGVDGPCSGIAVPG